jgi:penicillin-binding protein 1A
MSRLKEQWFCLPWWFRFLFWCGLVAGIAGLLFVSGVVYYYARQLPDFRTLADYQPSLITKIYAHDDQVLAEYARERRVYTAIEDVPQPLIEAFLAAEDTKFFRHGGFDLKAIFRAAMVNIFTNRIQGASTITQQVAKTFLLSNERTYTRKIKELILAWRIERAFSKNEILELYLNQIYLGNGAYGVGAAALSYFSKTLDELELGERALIAGLPKAPSRYNPVRSPQRAKARRDVILRRMQAEGFITPEEADSAISKAIRVGETALAQNRLAPHFSEHVRRLALERFSEEVLYHGGLKIYTTLDLAMQAAAEKALYEGLRGYDRRHGWRGALTNFGLLVNWEDRLAEEELQRPHLRLVGRMVVVLEAAEEKARIGFADGSSGNIPLAEVKWARRYIGPEQRGPKVTKVSDVLRTGDVVFVKPAEGEGNYTLEQVPEVQGAVVALDVQTGAIRAMVGGLGDGSGFNRAVQAQRQTGSVFKPFVYTAALESGMTPATPLLDAPVVFREGENEAWKPSNYSAKIYGKSTIRRGLEQSRNLLTVRLAREIGMGPVIRMARRFGLTAPLDRGDLTVALGSGSFSLLDITSAYTAFPGQGWRVKPFAISRVQDAAGDTVFRKHGWCALCAVGAESREPDLPPAIQVERSRVTSPQIAYQMVSMLQGVIQRGTGRRQRNIGHPVAGKTGTTNEFRDAWFVGFTPSLVVGVWTGFDTPQTLGKGEAGGRVASPIWGRFMRQVLKDRPPENFAVPPGISFVRIDAETGTLPTMRTRETLMEVFIEGTQPTGEALPAQPQLPEEGGLQPYGLF